MVNYLHDKRTDNWEKFLSELPKVSKNWRALNGNTATLKRQVQTVQLLIKAYRNKQPGVIIADDVGLGKTWVGIMAALAWAASNKSVLIVAPNTIIRDKWFEEISKWYGDDPNPGLWELDEENNEWLQKHPGDLIDWGRLGIERERLGDKIIMLVTASQFAKRNTWKCDLVIIDEAHRGKGENGLIEQIPQLVPDAFRILLTATPFGKDIETLSKLLKAAGCDDNTLFNQMEVFKNKLSEGNINQEDLKEATKGLRLWMIRHTLDTLPKEEQKQVGTVHHIYGSLISPEEADQYQKRTKKNQAIAICNSGIKNLILHAERLNQLSEISRVKTLVAPYSPQALKKIAAEKSETCTGVIKYHADKIIEISGKFERGPLEQALYNFAQQCFKCGEKFVVFCYHHQVADTVNKVLMSAWNDAKAQLSVKCITEADIEAIFKLPVRAIHSGDENEIAKYKTFIRKWGDESIHYLQINNIDGETILNLHLKELLSSLYTSKISADSSRPEGLECVALLKDLQGSAKNKVHHFFNSPFFPMALVATTADSEGIDLHRNCRIVVHYELGYRPETLLQANGRVRRVGSWAGKKERPILYYYPYLEGTRSEKLTQVVVKRAEHFGLLMGGAPNGLVANITSNGGSLDFTNKKFWFYKQE